MAFFKKRRLTAPFLPLGTHSRYSAAVEYAQSQWESVNKRVHYKMQEDGCVALVDPSHLNKLDKSRMSPFEASSPSVSSAAHSLVPIRTKLDPSLIFLFEQPKVETLNKVASPPLITNGNQFCHHDTIMICDTNEIEVSAPESNVVKPLTHQPARLCPFEVQPTSAQHVAPITINKLGESRMSLFEPSSSSVSAAHSSVPIRNKLDPSLTSIFEQPKVEPLSKVASPMITNVNQFGHQVTIKESDINEIVVSPPWSNIVEPSTQSNLNDDLDHHKRSSSIGSTGAKRDNMAATISNAENRMEKTPITAGTHSGSANIIKDKTTISQSKIPAIEPSPYEPRYMKGTISSAGKYRTKVKIPERPGFNHFTKPGPGFSSKIPIFSKHRRTGAEVHKAATVKNSAKQTILSRIPIPTKRSSHLIETVAKIVKSHGKNNEYLSGSGTETRKDYDAHTISSAAKSREKAPVINGKKWISSTRPNNPDGPINPLPSMENYRKKLDAPRKKLLAKIKANKKLALVLPDSFELRLPDKEQFDAIDGREWVYKDTNIYSSLPPMGDADDYEKVYREGDEYDDLCGMGGCGVVTFGWRRKDNKKVAVKKVNKSNVFEWGNVDGKVYPLEYCNLQILARAGGNRIAHILDGFDVGEEYVFILETLDDCASLSDYLLLRTTKTLIPFKEPHCNLIFRQLVQAVDQCHNSGIYHRDIKTSNILLDENTNEVKLIDFDTSALSCYAPFMANPGTDGYRSPEMYDGSVKYEGTPAAVYSMGVVLYDIVFGATGWKLNNKRLPMPKISTECLDLIYKMTATRPEDRLPFEKILDHPWMQST